MVGNVPCASETFGSITPEDDGVMTAVLKVTSQFDYLVVALRAESSELRAAIAQNHHSFHLLKNEQHH